MSLLPLERTVAIARALCTTRRRTMSSQTLRASQPRADTSVQPQFYRTTPPPHWTNVSSTGDISNRKFKSPWPSAEAHGFFSFLKARLFDWNEVPLPPKISSQPGGAALPPVNQPTWTASSGAQSSDKGVVFTWLGHAICHLQIPVGNGSTMTILCDPVLSQRVSPVQWIGPARYTDAPVSVDSIIAATEKDGKHAFPDLLVLSHNHYDHMDYTTISKLLNPPTSSSVKRPHVFCTLGNKAWFQSNFKLSDQEVTECDWWENSTVTLGDEAVLKLTCVPAQHFSGRSLFDKDCTLWAGWTFEAISPSSSRANVYFAGDTGYRSVPRGMTREQEDTLPLCPAFKEIGQALGPFDLSLIPIGAYLPRSFMSNIHLAPHDSVMVHKDVQSRKSYGIHWGSFRLTPEDVNEPPQHLAKEAARIGLRADEFEVLEIGQSVFVPVSHRGEEALPESKLGTKEHWDAVYQREVSNFNELGEEGEVWFGEDAVMRMVKFLENYYIESDTRFASPELAPTVLDLGTGNGNLLFDMLETSADLEDIVSPASMVGIDYSAASIDLAKAIGKKRGEGCDKVTFLQSDLLDDAAVDSLVHLPSQSLASSERKWDLVCDKGTMDAVALSSQTINGKLPIDLYTHAVAQLVKKDGLFLITSCNFTEQEVTERFTKVGFTVHTVLPTPTFTFGGAKGSTTTSIAFKQP